MPDIIPNESHKYTYVYKPHNYKINFSNINNQNIDFDFNMDSQDMKYGSGEHLIKNKYKKNGFNFLGWSMQPDLNNKIFDDEEYVLNLTSIDNGIVTLYPVFSPYSYTVNYIDEERNRNYYKTYNLFSDKALDFDTNNMPKHHTFIGWSYNGIRLKNNNTSELDKYIVDDNAIIILKAQYIINEKNQDISDDYKSVASGLGGSGGVKSNESAIDANPLNTMKSNDIDILNINNNENLMETVDDLFVDSLITKQNNTFNQYPSINKYSNSTKNDNESNDIVDNNIINKDTENKIVKENDDRQLVGIFLSYKTKILNDVIKNINYMENEKLQESDWRFKYNQMIIKIKQFLKSHKIFSNVIKYIFITILFLSLIILLIIILYIINKQKKSIIKQH